MKRKFLLLFLGAVLLSSRTFADDKIILDGHNLFPLTYWGDIKPGNKSTQIPLGFCDAQITNNEKDFTTRISGQALDGRKWELDLMYVPDYTDLVKSVFLGDLDQGGQKDLVIKTPTSLSGINPNMEFLVFFFDKKGYPHPQAFDLFGSQEAKNESILRDPKGRAVLVHKFLQAHEALTCTCNASFYVAVDSKWVKLDPNNLVIKNVTDATAFQLGGSNTIYEDEDSALRSCSASEKKDAPDFSVWKVSKFKRLVSYKSISAGETEIIAINSNGKKEKRELFGYEQLSKYWIFESRDEFKLVDDACMGEDTMPKLLDKVIKEKLPFRIVEPKNGRHRFIWFTKSLEGIK